MTPLTAVAFLIGIAKASGAGGATTAVLINVPGEPNAAVTCLDGYPLARNGKAKLALETALYGSVIGDVIGTLALIALAHPLAKFALGIGPLEMTALMLLALTFIATLAGDSLLRGLAAGIFGVFLATVGLDIESGTPRMTFGYTELLDGIPLLAVTVGMLGLSEMVIQAEELLSRSPTESAVAVHADMKEDGFGWRTLRYLFPTFLRSSIIGTAIGLIPGLGPSVASFASYGLAKHFARPGEEFGKGELKGVAAAETADNAVVPASFVPLFALGLPGSVSAAILIGALTIHGLTPGPRLFDENPRLIYGIFGTMIVAAVLMLVVGRIGLVAFAKLTRVPATIIIPVVVMLCIVGSHLEIPLHIRRRTDDRLCGGWVSHASIRLFARDVPYRVRHRSAVRALAPAVAYHDGRQSSGASRASLRHRDSRHRSHRKRAGDALAILSPSVRRQPMKININADIGESYGKFVTGNDAELMTMIGSASVACGMHAGDPTIMARTVRLALENNVSIGAHPGFNDLWGFGRRQIRMRPLDLEYLVTYQIGALQALAAAQGAKVTHVKPHGALNNMAHDDIDYALAIGRGIKAANPDLIYVANTGSQMTEAGTQLGLRVANEAYVDRRYDDNGKMVSREHDGAVIHDPAIAARQVVDIVREGMITSITGRKIPANVHTFCIHGDEPTAVPVMRAVRTELAKAGIETVTLPAMFE